MTPQNVKDIFIIQPDDLIYAISDGCKAYTRVGMYV